VWPWLATLLTAEMQGVNAAGADCPAAFLLLAL
jgi:hypothetical protein